MRGRAQLKRPAPSKEMVFDDIYRKHWDKVYRLCMGYLNDREWANDVAQETFITVWQQLPKFRGEAAIGTWIFRIAANNCLRQIEKSRRMPKLPVPLELPEYQEPDREPELEMLQRYISELAETDRIIILLELEDMKQAEIAEITGLTPANVRVRIHRIKEKLTQKFKQHAY